jgi:hypothetical protein
MILWLLGRVAWTQPIDTISVPIFELEYVVIQYVYKFLSRWVRFVVAILLHKSHSNSLSNHERTARAMQKY